MVEPYLNLEGKCNEAIDFYEKVFHGQDKTIMRYKKVPANPDYPVRKELGKLVLHAELTVEGTKIHFNDTQFAEPKKAPDNCSHPVPNYVIFAAL